MEYHNLDDFLIDKNAALERFRLTRERGDINIFTNGCFDILHRGHLYLFNQAKALGGTLTIGLNSDCSVQRLKGSSRPIYDQVDRAYLLSNLRCVDNVVLFDENTPCELISLLKPEIVVKASSYNPDDYEQMPEAKIVKEYGGIVKIFPLLEDYSTTKIISRK